MKAMRNIVFFCFLSVSTIIFGQTDYAASWQLVPKSPNAIVSKDTIIVDVFLNFESREIELVENDSVSFTGFMNDDLTFELSYVYRSPEDVPDLQNASDPRDSTLLKLYTKKENAIIYKGTFSTKGITSLTLYTPNFDESSQKRIEDEIIEYEVLPYHLISIYDKNGNESSITTNFSKPFSEITIEPSSVQVSQSSENHVSVEFEVAITDLVADIVNQKADIKEVFLEYLDPSTEEFQVTRKINFTKIDEESNKWRPFAHRYIAKIDASDIPLIGDETYVNVGVTNVLGNKSVASVMINSNAEGQPEDGIEIEGYTYSSYELIDAKGLGYSNPIQVYLTKADFIRNPNEGNIVEDSIVYNGRTFKMVLDNDPDYPNDFRLEAPLLGLDSIPESLRDVPNLVSVRDEKDSAEIGYNGFKEDLSWNYTAHSPPNIYTYALGLSYNHKVFDPDTFRKYSVSPKSSLNIIDENGKVLIGSERVRFLEVLNNPRGYSLEVSIPFNSNLMGKTVGVEFSLRNERGRLVKRVLGKFKIGTLKTVIVGVDGFAFDRALAVVNHPKAVGFGTAFRPSSEKDSVMAKVLSAIPTITHCNWTGIYSGQPPGEHGINGNSYLGFNSSGKVSKLVGLNVVALGFNQKAHRSAESMFDKIYPDYPINLSFREKLRVLTLYPWYSKSNNSKVDVDETRYTGTILEDLYIDPVSGVTAKQLSHHDPPAAKRLDFETYKAFSQAIYPRLTSNGRWPIDLVAMYFPGPDNVAHYLGDKAPPGFKKFGYNFSGIGNVHYSLGPALPEVDVPLQSIYEHAIQVTDKYLAANLGLLQNLGFLYSTMFVLVADHGLHAFRNDSQNRFNIFPDDVLTIIRNNIENTSSVRYLEEFKNYDVRLELSNNGKPPTIKDEDVLNFYQIYDKIREYRKNAWVPNGLTVSKKNNPGGRFWFDITKGKYANPLNEELTGIVQIYEIAKSLRFQYSANGGMAHLYVRSASNLFDNEFIRNASIILYEAATGKSKLVGENKLAPDPSLKGVRDGGALGHIPAIFVKVVDSVDDLKSRLSRPYRWVKDASIEKDYLEFGTIEEFLELSGYKGKWPDFEARLAELNDKSDDSRSGDIILFTDGAMGYLTVNEGDQFNGWHGGATKSESFIPMFINIPGNVVTNEGFIKTGFLNAESSWKARSPKSKYLRNWNLTEVLRSIYNAIPRN